MIAPVKVYVTMNWDNVGASMDFGGEGCSERLQLNCNYPTVLDFPYGRWVVSICLAHCDTTRAMCFCGEGTKYPNRPLVEACGFQFKLSSESDGPKQTDWARLDEEVFTTNGSKIGWCNVDPADSNKGSLG